MRPLSLLFGLLLCSPSVFAENVSSDHAMTPFASESITVSSTAVGFTSATYAPASGVAQRAFMTCETNPIRYWYDGSTPTTSVGHALAAATPIAITGKGAVANFRMIASGSDSTCRVTYER